MTGITFITIIMRDTVYRPVSSKAVPARSSGKGRLGTRHSVGK